MKVRRPALDFSDTPAHWAKISEYAQSCNATSLWIPYLERFLNRVLARALSHLKDEGKLTDTLRTDVRTFIRQESNHYALHEEFNSILPRNGYNVAHLEALFEAEFDKLLKTKSIHFLTAFCEGFETLGPPSALAWLDENEEMLVGAQPEVVTLWKWHLMEEYEHRMVCHDIFHAVHGGYFMRIYGFVYQLRMLNGFSRMARQHLLAIDRASMTPEHVQQSVLREKEVIKRQMKRLLPRLFKVFSPFYTPGHAPEPKMYKPYMAKIEAAL